MKCAAKAALTAIVCSGLAGNAYSATAQDAAVATAKKEDPPKATQTLDAVIGKTLIAIDGSMIKLTASEGRMAREIIGANGAVQRTSFVFINDRLGTVADARETAKVTGVFRATETTIEIQYGDGSSEVFLANFAGGISLETRGPASEPYCTSWYPEGHIFNLEERKTALAQFAMRLGLGDSADKKPVTGQYACKTGTTSAEVNTSSEKTASAAPAPAASPTAASPAAAATPMPPPMPAAAAPSDDAAKQPVVRDKATFAAPPRRGPRTAPRLPEVATPKVPPAKLADLGPTKPVEVRESEVHLIDVPKDTNKASPDAAVAPSTADVAAQIGASTCLSIESDGKNWGFKNHCGYTVQFAYCTMDALIQLSSCKDGSIGGSVAPNGFGALVADQSLKEIDVTHDFRWVACEGGAGEVIARLEKADPPAGRCVR